MPGSQAPSATGSHRLNPGRDRVCRPLPLTYGAPWCVTAPYRVPWVIHPMARASGLAWTTDSGRAVALETPLAAFGAAGSHLLEDMNTRARTEYPKSASTNPVGSMS